MPNSSRWNHLVHHVARGWLIARKEGSLYLSEYRTPGSGHVRQVQGRTLADLQRNGAKIYKTRVSAYQQARKIYPSGHPALQLSLGEDPWATVERQLEEAKAEIAMLRGERADEGLTAGSSI